MKNNCDMARDLMPLTIDGVASEASQNYVNEHLAECAECRAYLEGMNLRETVHTASAAAAIATESMETINPALSETTLRERIEASSEEKTC